MQKRSVVDQIEIQRDGTIQIRIAKEVVDNDGAVLLQEWHRTALPPGTDIDGQMTAVNAHLTTGLNCAPVDTACIARVKTAAKAFWTPGVLTTHRKRAKAEAAMMEARARG